MAITQKKTPYEMLVRWDDAGALRGAHVVFRESVLDADVEISSKIGEALSISLGGSQGFPLAEILSTVQSDALADAAAKTAELVTVTAEKVAAVETCTKAEALTEQLTAQVAGMQALQDQVTTLTADKNTAVASQASTAEQAAALTAALQVLTDEKHTIEADKATTVAALTADKATAVADKATAEAARDVALSQVDALNAQIAALQPPVNSFSRKIIKVSLSAAGLLDQFETTIAAPEDSDQKLAMISWQEDDMFTKTSPALALTFARMKLTDEQIASIVG